jgi:hypothetical protein
MFSFTQDPPGSDFTDYASLITSDYINNGYMATDWTIGCIPYTQAAWQACSPAVCTASQTLATVTEWRFENSKVWEGSCCDRLLPTIEPSSILFSLTSSQRFHYLDCKWFMRKGLFGPYNSLDRLHDYTNELPEHGYRYSYYYYYHHNIGARD